MSGRYLIKKWWFWLVIILILIILFFPIFNCQNTSVFSDANGGIRSHGAICQSLTDLMLHGKQFFQ